MLGTGQQHQGVSFSFIHIEILDNTIRRADPFGS